MILPNLKNEALIPDIEAFLLKQTKKMPKDYFKKKYGAAAEENALDIIRYLIEGVFHWTPLEAGDYLTDKVLEAFNITPLTYLKYIEFPAGIGNKKIDYILTRIYPNVYKFNKYQHYLDIYKDVLSNKSKFPKNFFNGTIAAERASVCLQYLINNYLFVSNIEDLYTLFSSKDITPLLRNYNLLTPCQKLYPTPVDFLHDTLPDSQKDYFLYYWALFTYENQKTLGAYYKGDIIIKPSKKRKSQTKQE